MYLIYLLCFCLLLLSCLTVLAKQVEKLRSTVLAYGKLKLNGADQPNTYWTIIISQWTVPKYYFSHFYVIGLLFAIECLLELSFIAKGHVGPVLYLVRHFDTPVGSSRISRSSSLICLCLMTLHLSKRVYESFFIEKPSKSAVMHVSHYLVGIGFYGAVVFGTWLEGAAYFGVWSSGKVHAFVKEINDIYTTSPPMLATIIGILLFGYASYHQHVCHCILASLRENKTKGGYSIPRGDWFEWIVTPHYFADILIYLSFNILFQFKSYVMVSVLIWTVFNLSTTADETNTWYKNYFGEKYKESFPNGRWRIIPFIY